MKAPVESSSPSLCDFWDDNSHGSSVPSSPTDNYSSSKKRDNHSVSDLLNWISNVQIKRRKFRKRSRCSNLLAEATLSSTLRQAKIDLHFKQEEKRRKAQEFSYQINMNIQYSQVNSQNNQSETKYFERVNNQISQSYNLNNNLTENNNQCRKQDEHVQACINSLDNFFSELKSIKV